LFIRQGPPRRLLWDSLSRRPRRYASTEEAEAKPTESEVVVLAEFNKQLYAPKIEFIYSLKKPLAGGSFALFYF